MAPTNNEVSSVAHDIFHLWTSRALLARIDGDAVQDTGIMLNPDAPASDYSVGLSGVDQHVNYLVSNISVATFCILLACIVIYQLSRIAHAHVRRLVAMGRETDQRYWMVNHNLFWTLCKKHLLYAPLGKVRHNRELQLSSAVSIGTLPGRFHTLVLFTYLISNFAFCLALDWSKDNLSVVAELRGRTGQLAALNIIPTVLFALRNNPLIYITHISYDTFNLFHRWSARLVVIESVIHTICWAVNNLKSGGQDQVDVGLASSVSFQAGMLGTVVFCLILVVSMSPIRHAFYETFLASHRLLVLIGLTGVYVHLQRARLPQIAYIQLVFALWGAELAMRYGKIVYVNISRQRGVTQITVEALPEGACRVTFDLKRPWTYRPGCHIHAYLPAIAAWSSHPFSVAWAESTLNTSTRMAINMEKLGSNHFGMMTPRHTTSAVTIREDSTVPPWSQDCLAVDRIHLVCRARTGFTKTMYDKAVASPSGRFTTWGFLEGLYGGQESFASYCTVVLFAGGVGITHCLGYVLHLLQLYQHNMCATRKILLVWSVPNTECLEWTRTWMDHILKMEGRRELVRIHLYVTKPKHHLEVASSTGKVQLFPGRCNPEQILSREVEQRIGAMAVTVCGPGAFADSVRAAARANVTEGVIDFVEEAFTY